MTYSSLNSLKIKAKLLQKAKRRQGKSIPKDMVAWEKLMQKIVESHKKT